VDGELELRAYLFGEFFDLDRLGGVSAGEAEGESDDDLDDVVVADDFCELLEVGALVAALEGVDTLGGDAEEVGDGHADTAVSDVESEEAAGLLGICFVRSGAAHGTIIGRAILLGDGCRSD